jgi:hypothetical protein
MKLARRALWAIAALVGIASTVVVALQGVVEQTIEMPDAIYAYTSTEVQLEADAFDVNQDNEMAISANPTYTSWASYTFYTDGQHCSNAETSVGVFELLDDGNCSGGAGMQTTKTLQQTYDADVVTVHFVPHDNPYGSVKVELIQKTYVTVWIKFSRQSADNQIKYYYFRVVNTLIDESLQETSFEWSESTVTSTSSGVGVELSIDGEVTVSTPWSDTVDQGTDGFEHIAASRIDPVQREIVFVAAGHGDPPQAREVTVDCGFNWNLNTVDENDWEVSCQNSKLEGKAFCYPVIGFGRITILKNTNGTTLGCPLEWHPGTDIGNPELEDDRDVAAVVSYELP